MADVRAFGGYRYNADRVGLAAVVAPPYDVLSDAEVAEYKARSPYNVVHLTRPGTEYEQVEHRVHDWIADSVWERDPHSIYLHEVTWNGHVRRDLLGALRLQAYEDRVVLPHERTHRGPKEDRLALLRATGWALEPLWFLYDGGDTAVPELLEEQFAEDPAVEFEFPAGEHHRLWVVSDRDWHRRLSRALAPLPVLIADGHHRYETALAYAEEVGGRPDASSRFTPALLTDLNDPGLVVLPTHRLVKAGVAVTGGEEVASLREMEERLAGHVAAGTYREGRYQVLELEGEVAVVELHRQVIDNILGKRNPEEYLSYTRDAEEAVRAVDEGRAASAFFLGPPDLKVVLEQAREGKTMPQKTTYFHPKPPSGMVFHKLDPDAGLED
jgi:uncharacterized protein (DUF1015 family)